MGGLPQKRPRNLKISEFCPKEASPQRSDGHLGEAEGVNQTFLREITISAAQSPVEVLVIPANEERGIAEDVLACINHGPGKAQVP